MFKDLLSTLWQAKYRGMVQSTRPTDISSLLEQEFYSRDPEFYAGKWQEEDHPRDDDGKFGEGGGTATAPDETEFRKELRSDGAQEGDMTALIVPHPSGHGYATELGDGDSVDTVGDPHDTMADAEDAAIEHLGESQGTLFGDIEPPTKKKRGRPKKKDFQPLGTRRNEDGRVVGTTVMDRDDIVADPKRFQYKIVDIDEASGVTKELREVKRYNPIFGGQLLVWHDTEDDKTYVVNGHHRLELAKRSPHTTTGDDIGGGRIAEAFQAWSGEMTVLYLNVNSPAKARSLGALANIAEGRGTATDAAEYLRGGDYSIEDAAAMGVSFKGKVARKASWMASLPDAAFTLVKQGRLDEDAAVEIGRYIPEGTDGRDRKISTLIDTLRNREERTGETLAPNVVREMAKRKALAPTVRSHVKDLFGDRYEEDDLSVEIAQLGSKLLFDIKRIKNTSKTAGKDLTKKILEGEGVNVIDVKHNRQKAEEMIAVEDYLKSQMYLKGPLANKINAAAEELKNAATKPEKDRIHKQLGLDIADHIHSELGYGQEEVGDERGIQGYSRRGGAATGTGFARRHSGGLDMLDREDYASAKNLFSIEFLSRGFGKQALYRKDEDFPEPVMEVPTENELLDSLNKEFNSRWEEGDDTLVERYDDEEGCPKAEAYRKARATRKQSEQYGWRSTALKIGAAGALTGYLMGKKSRDERRERIRRGGEFNPIVGPGSGKQYGAFEESKISRDEGGQFSSGGGGGGGESDIDAEERRIQELEAEGMTRSDAQGVYDAEQLSIHADDEWTDEEAAALRAKEDRDFGTVEQAFQNKHVAESWAESPDDFLDDLIAKGGLGVEHERSAHMASFEKERRRLASDNPGGKKAMTHTLTGKEHERAMRAGGHTGTPNISTILNPDELFAAIEHQREKAAQEKAARDEKREQSEQRFAHMDSEGRLKKKSTEHYAQETKWVSFQGPQGGKGWKNTRSGEVLYQEEMPGEQEGAQQEPVPQQSVGEYGDLMPQRMEGEDDKGYRTRAAEELPTPKELPEDHGRYFNTDKADGTVPVDQLKHTRARPSGIANGAKFMRMAFEGLNSKRDPISVRKEADGSFTVLDGNSTYAVAKAAGWSSLPVNVVEGGEEAREGHSTGEAYAQQLGVEKVFHPSLDGMFSDEELHLGDSYFGPAQSWEEAKSQGVEVLEAYNSVLDLGRGVSTDFEGSTVFQPKSAEEFQAAIDEIGSGKKGVAILLAPLKGEKRARHKVEGTYTYTLKDGTAREGIRMRDEGGTLHLVNPKDMDDEFTLSRDDITGAWHNKGKYNGDWGELADVVRGTIAVDTIEGIPAVMDSVRKHMEAQGFTLSETPKDRFSIPTREGYRDISMKMKSPSGMAVELQINTKAMVAMKEGPGHKLFEQAREIKEGPDSPNKQKRMDNIAAKSREVYDIGAKYSVEGIPEGGM